jgi:hypothetical protein
MHYDQDGNPIDGHPDLLRTTPATVPSSSQRESPAQMTSVPESSAEIAATIDHSQSAIDNPQNNVITPLTLNFDLAADRQAEVEERTPIVELQTHSEPIPQLPIEDKRVNRQLEISRDASGSALGSSLAESDGMFDGAETQSRISSQAEREAGSTIQQDPSSTPFVLSSTDADVAKSESGVPERPSTPSSSQLEDDILQESDPDVVYFWRHDGEVISMPFQKCRTYEVSASTAPVSVCN